MNDSDAIEQAEQVRTRRERRFRFSLRGLILVLALFCAVVSHVLTSVELRRVRNDARLLRDELGYLSVTDQRKLHVIAVAPDLGYTTKRWRWRVHFPEGRRFRVCYKFTELPMDGIPNDMYEFFNDVQGEVTINASAVRDPGDRWKFVIGYEDKMNLNQTRTQTIPNATWLADDASMSWSIAGDDGTVSVDIGNPLELLKLRRTKTVTSPTGGTGTTVETNPTDGIQLWIEEEP